MKASSLLQLLCIGVKVSIYDSPLFRFASPRMSAKPLRLNNEESPKSEYYFQT